MLTEKLQQREVSILRPLGYEPSTLPLRHSAPLVIFNFGITEEKSLLGVGFEPTRDKSPIRS